MTQASDDPFEGVPIISRYTDADAREDGVLVAINKKDRLTRTVFEFLAAHTPLGSKPPNRWPVDLRGWFGAIGTEAERDTKAVALAAGLIGSHERTARRIYRENIGGGIWTGWAAVKDGVLVAFQEADATGLNPAETVKLWLLPNELGGLTLMFPDDY